MIDGFADGAGQRRERVEHDDREVEGERDAREPEFVGFGVSLAGGFENGECMVVRVDILLPVGAVDPMSVVDGGGCEEVVVDFETEFEGKSEEGGHYIYKEFQMNE